LTRRLLVPGLTTLALFCILLTLGFWQLHRLAWKEALLAEIAHAERAPPVPLTGAAPSRFARVTVSGTLRPGVFALYGADVRDIRGVPAMGAQLLQILDRPGDAPILVDLGWVPADLHTPIKPREGAADVTGFVRPAEHAGFLAAPDDPDGRRFYTLDPAAIGRALGVPALAPFTLVAEGPAPPSGPIPAETLPSPPNNHLQYAWTWFGLAGSLLVVFAAWARKPGIAREPT